MSNVKKKTVSYDKFHLLSLQTFLIIIQFHCRLYMMYILAYCVNVKSRATLS